MSAVNPRRVVPSVPHGRATISDPFANWTFVREAYINSALAGIEGSMWSRILSKRIMLCLIPALTIRMRTERLDSAKCSAFIAASVVFPTCRPQQAAINGDWSRRNSS
jgi:hypothetical protein